MEQLETLFTLNIFGYTIPVVKTMIGVFVELLLILGISLFLFIKRGTVKIAFEILYEFMYGFFEEILGTKEKKRIKGTVTTIFFVIFFANILGWLGDILSQGIESLEHRFSPFSSGVNGTIAMSLTIVILTLVIQLINLGNPIKFILEYLPITGRGYLTIDRKEGMNNIIYYIGYVFIKIFDIIVSVFIGLLDIVGNLAKIISLAFRLYGNMLAGTTLLVLLTEATSGLTHYLLGFDFPIIFPLILFIQGLLVASIQAFVVALLTSIFIKMFQVEEKEEIIENKTSN